MKYKCENCNSNNIDIMYKKSNDTYICKCLSCKSKTFIYPTDEEKEKIAYNKRYNIYNTLKVIFFGVLYGCFIGELIPLIIQYYKG